VLQQQKQELEMAPQDNLICIATYRKNKRESKDSKTASTCGNQVELLIDSLRKMAELYQKQSRTSR
jgi:hypothetical protein